MTQTNAPSDIERVMADFRRDVLRRERAAASEMVRRYGGIWQRIKLELAALQKAIAEARDAGETVDVAWLLRQERYTALLQHVEGELRTFAAYAESAITQQQVEAITAAQAHAEAIVRAQMGPMPEALLRAGVTLPWNRLPTGAIREMTGAMQEGSPLRALLDGLAVDGGERARSVLLEGLALGQNPSKTARQMRKALGVELNRALTISRTETLRAYREATRASWQENDSLVKGWEWRSARDYRTCAACWAMHGTRHRLDEPLDDHPNGRCVMRAISPTWAELGKELGVDLSDVPERQRDTATGAELFATMPEDMQRSVLGDRGYEAYAAGKVKLEDFVGRKRSRAWGTMRYARPLKAIIGDQAES
jgi:SPP1 gp7 family putative phage head morphogenesis protein